MGLREIFVEGHGVISLSEEPKRYPFSWVYSKQNLWLPEYSENCLCSCVYKGNLKFSNRNEKYQPYFFCLRNI